MIAIPIEIGSAHAISVPTVWTITWSVPLSFTVSSGIRLTKEGEYYRLAESEDDESDMEGSREYIRALYQVALNLEIGDSEIWEAKSKAELGQDFDMGELGGEA